MSTGLTGMVFNARRGRLKRTGQLTCYHVGDDGDKRRGLLEQFDVLTLGTYSGSKNIEVAHYAGNQISFAAPFAIADAGAGLADWAVNDLMVIKGTAGNNGVVTVTGLVGAPAALQISAAVNEGAGAYVKLYKRTSHLNECVRDLRTGLMWSRYTSNGEKVGEASNGTLIWADVTKVYTIYSVANTISMILPNIFRITGGAALTQFDVGDVINLAGFATATNNLPGFYVTAVTVNGPDLDITIDPSNQILVAEGAVGDSIGLVTRSIYNYAAGANLAGLGGYTDWRVPDATEELSLMNMEAPDDTPNAVAFPAWPSGANVLWSSTTRSGSTTQGRPMLYGGVASPLTGVAKTSAYLAALVRGGL